MENVQGSGKAYLTSLVNCDETLDTLVRLLSALDANNSNYHYFKGCLSTLIADKTLEIANKHEKKRQLDNLKKSLEKLQDCIREEKKSFNSAVVFKKKEMDFKRKHEECQRFYENKANEYHKQIKLCEELLSEVGFNDQLREESVAQLSEENNQLKDTLKELNEKLNTYSFRPNKASLEAEIEQIQAEIDSMSEDFDKIMADT